MIFFYYYDILLNIVPYSYYFFKYFETRVYVVPTPVDVFIFLKAV